MALTLIILFLAGLVFGSFLNVWIWRVRNSLDWVRGKSQCDNCAHPLSVLDLIPVASWLFLRGRCRYCGCTDAHGCAIVVMPSATDPMEFEPTMAHCSWIDDEQTICTNLACLDRWRREEPQRLIIPPTEDQVAAVHGRKVVSR